MIRRRSLLRTALFCATLSAAIAGGAQAQELPLLGKNPTAVYGPNLFDAKTRAPDINGIPVLVNIVRGGAKLYYMGQRSGLDGWLIVKNGEIQMIYLTADRQTTVLGALFTAQGDNVTGAQVNALAQRDREVNALVNGFSAQQNEINAVGAAGGGAVSLPGSPQAATNQPLVANVPGVTLSPGDRLYQDMKAAAGVELGKGDGPEVMIVVAPSCPNCKKTWMELRDAVKAGTVRARLIPVYNSVGGDEANVAAQLLRVKDPLDEWDRHVQGDRTALAGKADDLAIKAVVANLNLVNKWNIKGYPYLVYRGKDGRVKIVQGRPERMAAVLLDLSK